MAVFQGHFPRQELRNFKDIDLRLSGRIFLSLYRINGYFGGKRENVSYKIKEKLNK
jgi:hypothetical protein